MKLVGGSSVWQGVVALAMVAALAGCSSSAPTPIVILVTSTPAASTPSPTQTPEVTPTPSPEVTATPSPTNAAAACTGTAAHQAFFINAAADLPFDVYCAVLPSSWWLDSASYEGPFLEVAYKNAAGATIWIYEGGWCPPDGWCIAPGAPIGSASFDGLAGTLYFMDPAYTLQVGTVADPRYLMFGHSMSQAQFVAYAAAVVKVPKS